MRKSLTKKLQLQAFLVELTAASALYDASFKFVMQHQHPDAVRKLNEGEPIWGIPPQLYDTVRGNLANSRNRQLLKEAWRNHETLRTQFANFGLADAAPYKVFSSND